MSTSAQAILSNSHGILGFLSELRRRRVCRAATMYSVALWLIVQIVELVAPEIGLPHWTLKLVILFGLLGFPITLILSWMLEITPDGIVIDDDKERSREPRKSVRLLDRIIDLSLVIVALLIGMQLAASAVDTARASDALEVQKIVVEPFRVSAGSEYVAWSEGLVVELHHALATKTGMTVIAPRDPYEVQHSLRLTGAVSIQGARIHVTVTVVDSDSGVVTWSQKFLSSHSNELRSPDTIAAAIVDALPEAYGLPEGAQVSS